MIPKQNKTQVVSLGDFRLNAALGPFRSPSREDRQIEPRAVLFQSFIPIL